MYKTKKYLKKTKHLENYIIQTQTPKSKLKTTIKQINKNDNNLSNNISRLSTVSKTPKPLKKTYLDLLELPIIKNDNFFIPQMKLNKSTPNKSTETDNYIIAIPSYNRHDIIQKKTLKLLNTHNISNNKINIFVSDKEQYDLYTSSIPKNLYNTIIIGVLGLKNQRNFIMNYYPEGTHIVQMDDDVDKIMELTTTHKQHKSTQKNLTQSQLKKDIHLLNTFGENTTTKKNKNGVKPIENLNKFIIDAFKMCTDKKIFLWGVYPLANPKFMFQKITTNLRFIVGPFWGMINRHNKQLLLTIDEKEDTERTLQFWTLDKSVLRFNNIGIVTKYYTNKGGMQSEHKNRKLEAQKSAQYLHNLYPHLTKIYLKKKSGYPEIKFIKT